MSPGDDREGGFIAIHRRLRSSALFRSLSAEQRSVFLAILLLANWKEGRFLHGGAWVVIHRGELAHSLATIAAEAGVTVKVVRSTLAKLMADDRQTGTARRGLGAVNSAGCHMTHGNGPFLTGRWTGTEPGTGLRVLRVEKYAEYQDLSGGRGTEPGTATGTAGAREGHASGTAGAPIEPREPGKPRETCAESPADAGALAPSSGAMKGGAQKAGRPSKLNGAAHQAVIETFTRLWLEVRGGDPYPMDGAKDGAAVKRLLRMSPAAADPAEAEIRVRRYLSDPWCSRNGGLAHFCSRWPGLDGADGREPPRRVLT